MFKWKRKASQDPTTHYQPADPTPMAIPIGAKRPERLQDQIARLVRNHDIQRTLAAAGMETFQDADDFDIEDDPIDPTTPYESDFDHANIHAMDRGVVRHPTSEEIKNSKETLSRFRKKPKSDKQEELSTPPVAHKKAQGGVDNSVTLGGVPKGYKLVPEGSDEGNV